MKTSYVAIAAALAASSLAGTAAAGPTLVSTISGGYDTLFYDTPGLTINNPTGFSFSNVQIVLTGYQGLNNGITKTINLGNVAGGGSENVIWLDGFGGTIAGDLFSYDYDDSYGFKAVNPACTIGTSLCAQVGNFKVTFTAHWNNPAFNGGAGVDIFSVFSPTTNATGGFFGWEGLDQNGWSESSFDTHSGGTAADLANIYIGKPGVPEPMTWGLMIAGFAAAGSVLRRSRKGMPLEPVF